MAPRFGSTDIRCRERNLQQQPGLAARLAEWKAAPMVAVEGSRVERPLFPGLCVRCCPVEQRYWPDIATPQLALARLTWSSLARLAWSSLARAKLVAGLYLQYRDGGLLIHPGQVEVVAAALQAGRALLVWPGPRLTLDDAALLRLLLEGAGLSVLECGVEPGPGQLAVAAPGPLPALPPPHLLLLAATFTRERDRGGLAGRSRLRLDLEQPSPVREVAGLEGGPAQQLDRLHHHLEWAAARATRLTAVNLLSFLLTTRKVEDTTNLDSLARGLTRLVETLTRRGLDLAWSGEASQAVVWGAEQLGGGLDRAGSVWVGCGEEELTLQAAPVIRALLPEAVVGLLVQGLVEAGRVSRHALLERGELLLQLLGEDRTAAPPCTPLSSVLLDGLALAEEEEGLSRGEAGSRPTRHWQEEEEEDWVRGSDTLLTVAPTPQGRAWLSWVSELLRPRVCNLQYTLYVLQSAASNGTPRAVVVERVRRLVSQRLDRNWRCCPASGHAHTTLSSLVALERLGVCKEMERGGAAWVELKTEFQTGDMLEEMLKLVLEFRC